MSHLFIPDQYEDCSYVDGKNVQCPLPERHPVHITENAETQPGPTAPAPRDGSTYDDQRDRARLTRQASDVWKAIQDGRWHTAAEIAKATGWPEQSVSARLRDFRKKEFGARNVESRPCADSRLWEYRLRVPVPV